MAVTTGQVIEFNNPSKLIAFPVKASNAIYKDTLVIIDQTGYVTNLTTSNEHQGRLIGVAAEDFTSNSTAGSISGNLEKGTNTVKVYLAGQVKLTFSAIAQSDVGKVVYATDNFTLDESRANSIAVGTLVAYISSTSGWVDLGNFTAPSTMKREIYGTLADTTSTTAGAAFEIANPEGEKICVEEIFIESTSATTSTAWGVSAGAGSTGTENTNLLGATTLSTGLLEASNTTSTAGGITFATSTEYIQVTNQTGSSGGGGKILIRYSVWE